MSENAGEGSGRRRFVYVPPALNPEAEARAKINDQLKIREQESINFSPEELELQKKFMMSLFSLTPEEKEVFRGQVSQHKGRVRVFVHPYFEFAYESKKNNEFIGKGLERILAKPNSSTPPVIILQEKQNLARTKKRLIEVIGKSGHMVYFVATGQQTPYPVWIPEMPDTARERAHANSSDERWNFMTKSLQELGVTNLVVAGEIFEVYREEKPSPFQVKFRERREALGATRLDYNIAGCAGEAMRCFARDGFKVEVSGLVTPSSRTDMVRLERAKP